MGLFGNSRKDNGEVAKEATITKAEYNRAITDLQHRHELEVAKMESDHAIALKEKEFELKHFKDERVKALETEGAKKDLRIAVLENENKMLDKITDLNGDIVDVKDLVNKLIEKLPNIDIKSLSVTGSSKE